MLQATNIYASLLIAVCTLICNSGVYSQTHNITAVGFESPINGSIVKEYTPALPVIALFYNSGYFDETNVKVIVSIQGNNINTFRDTQYIALFESGDTQKVTFRSYYPYWLGEHSFCAVSILASDISSLDDTSCGMITLRHQYDAQANAINFPAKNGRIPEKVIFNPSATFTSIGFYDYSNLRVRVRIRSNTTQSLVFQSDTVIPTLLYGVPTTCSFPGVTQYFNTRLLPTGEYTIGVNLIWPSEADRTNDTCYSNFSIVKNFLPNDVKVDTFIVPTDSLWGFNSTIPIKFSFTNVGKNTQHNVKVYGTVWNSRFKKYIYQDSAVISELAAGETRIVSFRDLKIPGGLNYGGSGHFGATIAIQGDEYPEDNHRSFFHKIGYDADLEVTTDYPSTIKMRQGTVFNPKAKVSLTWVSDDLLNTTVFAEIRRCDNDILVYSSQVVVPLLTYDSSSKEVSFPVNGIIGTTTLSPGCYTMILYTAPIANSDPSNNFASSSLIIYDKTDNNIKATSIVSPMNNSVSYGKFKVLASYTSTGLNDQNDVMVTTMIKDPSQDIVYRDTAFIANARTAFSDTVAFRPFTPLTNGKFTVYSISHLTNDETTMDDTLISTFEQDRHASIHISYIPYPTVNDTLLKGNEFICRGEFWLLGDSISQLYSVPVRVLLYRVDNGRLVFQADTIIDVFLVDGKVNTISFPSRQGSYNTAGIKGGEHIVCMMSMLNTNPLPHDSTCGLFTILPIESSAAPLQEQYNKNITVENFPNPFSTTTTLSYEVASAGYVTMRILDVAGVNLETVMSDVFVSEGKHEVALDGSHLPSGTYFVEMVVTNSEGMLARKIQPITVRR